jgi:hypothetical protein
MYASTTIPVTNWTRNQGRRNIATMKKMACAPFAPWIILVPTPVLAIASFIREGQSSRQAMLAKTIHREFENVSQL